MSTDKPSHKPSHSTKPTAKQVEQLKKWSEVSNQQGLSNEWVVAARLGVDAYTDEQVEMIANLFGR